jgi:hypothetical protein
VTPLRAVLLLAAGAAAVAAVALEPPELYAPLALAGIVLFVFGAGSLAFDAIPLRPVGATCSALTLALGFVLIVRPPLPLLLALAAVALQLAPSLASRWHAIGRKGST